jgi:hypothetical protein
LKAPLAAGFNARRGHSRNSPDAKAGRRGYDVTMGATDVRFTEILAVKLAVGAAGVSIHAWLESSVGEQQQQRRREGEPSEISGRMLWVMLSALGVVAGAALVITRWIATGRGPGVRVLVLLL